MNADQENGKLSPMDADVRERWRSADADPDTQRGVASAQANREHLDSLSRRIIGCAYTVGNVLGSGFLEKVYENALTHELAKAGKAETQVPISVFYDGTCVGEYAADILVEQSVLIELKAVKELDEVHIAQCMNYLRATGLKVCLLVNFGAPRVRIKRIVNRF